MKISSVQAFLSYTFLFSVALSCASAKEVPTEEEGPCKIRLSEKELTEILFSRDQFNFDHFNTKISIDLESTTQSRSFTATVKLRTDSAFSGTIKVAAIVAATYLVSMDSVIFVNKYTDCFFKENLSFVSSMFGTEIEFDFFQDLILGLPPGLEADIKYKEIHDKFYHVLSSHKKGKFKRIDKDRLKDETNDLFIQYYLDCDSKQLSRVDIQIPADTTKISIQYLERELIDGFYAPKLTNLSIVHPRDSLMLKLDYGSTRINERKEISISIPETYEECP